MTLFWNIAVIITMVCYAIALAFIFLFSIVQLNLVFAYLREKRKKASAAAAGFTQPDELLPVVTVQLPVYNEMYVAERLLKAVAALDYPAGKLEIQVLDDSTDETVTILERQVAALRKKGINILHIRRGNRQGFKAGALEYGLEIAAGQFIAIFDADFLPAPDFLRRTIPAFSDPALGVVQTKWEHLNEKFSLLTKLQAFGLNAHFSIEQKGRNSSGYFINFNGTAGVWRKSCIMDSGGWQSDTLTEDLDLSYRAQLRGWKFLFMEEVGTPAELPVTMSALKNQQYRWNKGAAECARKNLADVLKQKGIGTGKKLNATFHLLNSTVFIAIMITSILSIPVLFIKHQFPALNTVFLFASFFLVGFLMLAGFYYTAFIQTQKKFPANLFRFVWLFPLFLSVSMGLALHNAIAVLEGFAGRKTSFIRTPKFNITSPQDTWRGNKYHVKGLSWITVMEATLAAYFTCGILLAIRLDDYGLLPFHVMLAVGYAIVFIYSINHTSRFFRSRNPGAHGNEVALGV
ncbi:MAG: glycosyltransferase [Bacteroidetes bacterium]|nr:glycosyltransferase [Bacteroidota bacterium]